MSRTGLLAALFLLSGSCGLVFETLWFHEAAIAVGNSIWAASLVLAAFMAGMGIGNAWIARYGDRVRDNLRLYAALEVGVALTGLALVYGLPEFGPLFARIAGALAPQPLLLGTLRFASAFSLLLVPSLAMGSTLPLLVRAASAWDANFGRVLGILYGANTLGAVLGAVACESWLIPGLGILATGRLAGAANCSAALIALAIAARLPHGPEAPSPEPASAWHAGLPLLAAGFLAGALLLCLEVVWLRFLMLFLNNTPLAFAWVVALVLLGIALGSLLASLWSTWSARAPDHAYWVAYAGGLLGVAGYLVYPKFLKGAFPAYQPAATIVALAAPLVLPTSLASGALFTLLGAALRRVVPSASAAAGRLSLANTFGAGLGSLIGGFVLLPRLGMERSLLGALAAYGVIGYLLAWRSSMPRGWRDATLLGFIIALALFPLGSVRDQYIAASAARWMRGDAELAGVREGLTATVMHVVHREHGVPVSDQIATDSYSMSSNNHFGRRYMKLFVYLPLALHPKLERALIVGYGIGNTLQALADSAELRHIDLLDVSRDLLDAGRGLRIARTPSALQDPRVQVRIEDGRFFLQATEAQYDLITGEPPPPIMAGVVHLYTTEYFRLVRSRLAPEGIATYWLPVINISAPSARSIIAGFCAAFSDCSLWHGASHNFVLMGSRDRHGPVSEARFTQQWRDPAVRGELANLGFELPAQLGALFIGDAPYLRALTQGDPPLTDDRPGLIQPPYDKSAREALLTSWRDAAAARERFQNSPLIQSLFPAAIRREALAQFDVEWLINDLSFPSATVPHDSQLLYRVLLGTQLRWPVLLLLRSDPDIQRAMTGLSAEQRERPEWLVHRAAAQLADRDYDAAISVVDRLPPTDLPMPGLADCVEALVERAGD